MGGDRQIQKAGDGSQQIQAESVTIIQGITEERVRTIFAEQSALARKEYTEDAYRIADERVGKFEERFMPRITQVENALPSFADPAFQFLLRHAQQSAAATEREADYHLLTELLVCHVQKGNDRKNRAGINRAVEIVGEIDNDALCGLTVAHAITQYSPVSGICSEGIGVLNDLFSKLMYQELPPGDAWLDHLDVLGAVRLSSFGNLKKLDVYYSESLEGYVCTGLRVNSDEYNKAITLLDESKIGRGILVQNEFLNDYYRLAITAKNEINRLHFNVGAVQIPLSQEQIDALNQIWELYSKDESLKNQVKQEFIEMIDSFEVLHKIREWWDKIPHSFSITQVGRVLAQTNAKRCDPSLPDLI